MNYKTSYLLFIIHASTLALIRFYQRTLSPFLVSIFGRQCRFSPTCSVYTYQAIERYGIIKGSVLGIQRILRCNPLFKGGDDPIPN